MSVYLLEDGSVLLDADGAVALGEGCCCFPPVEGHGCQCESASWYPTVHVVATVSVGGVCTPDEGSPIDFATITPARYEGTLDLSQFSGTPPACIAGFLVEGGEATMQCEAGGDPISFGIGAAVALVFFASGGGQFYQVPGWDRGGGVDTCNCSDHHDPEVPGFAISVPGSFSFSQTGDHGITYTWTLSIYGVPCCYKITQTSSSYSDNHYNYPAGDCTPDYGSVTSSRTLISVYHYGDDGLVSYVECSGSSLSNCAGSYGTYCPPSEDTPCLWGRSCSGSWTLYEPSEDGCFLDESCGGWTPNPCGLSGCYPCPYGTPVCSTNFSCDDGQDCYIYVDLGGGAYCSRSFGHCNTTTKERETC